MAVWACTSGRGVYLSRTPTGVASSDGWLVSSASHTLYVTHHLPPKGNNGSAWSLVARNWEKMRLSGRPVLEKDIEANDKGNLGREQLTVMVRLLNRKV